MANLIYDSFKGGMNGDFDWDDAGQAIKVMLVQSGYSPVNTHDFKSDITNEASGTNYSAGGQTLNGRSVTIDNGNNKAVYDATDALWASSSVTARGAVIYKDTGNASTSPLVGYVDFGSDKQSINGDFTIQWSADGIFTIA